MVNDERTELKTRNAQAVLDGDLDEFIEAYLLKAADEARGRRRSHDEAQYQETTMASEEELIAAAAASTRRPCRRAPRAVRAPGARPRTTAPRRRAAYARDARSR